MLLLCLGPEVTNEKSNFFDRLEEDLTGSSEYSQANHQPEKNDTKRQLSLIPEAQLPNLLKRQLQKLLERKQ